MKEVHVVLKNDIGMSRWKRAYAEEACEYGVEVSIDVIKMNKTDEVEARRRVFDSEGKGKWTARELQAQQRENERD